jgi:wobble nucleotide-excising tRNase
VAAGAALPLKRLTVVYAENGRGKTTLAAIFRSLASGDPISITERHRLAAPHPPHVVIQCSDGTQAIFQNGVWTQTIPNLAIFDDVFVDENIYSGLVVGPGHRQNLHELILGSQGVALNRLAQDLTARIERHNSDLRTKSAAIPATVRKSFSVDDFCSLSPREDIDEAIASAERALAAAQGAVQVQRAGLFEPLLSPSFDLPAVEALVASDLPAIDELAVRQVEEHLSAIGANSAAWVADGMGRLDLESSGHESADCPFCAQGLAGSPVIESYRAYFSEAYREYLDAISSAVAREERTHGGDALAGFERSVRDEAERREFWAKYADVPAFEIDTAAFARSWIEARDAVLAALRNKAASPLSTLELPDEVREKVGAYEAAKESIEELSRALVATNLLLEAIKEQVRTADVGALRSDLDALLAIRGRQRPEVASQCDEYLAEKAAKATTQTELAQAQADLEQYRQNAFPDYQAAINVYLGHFGAGFRLDRVTAGNARGGPTCTYNVIINNHPVAISGTTTPGQPSFRNTLSAGDRNTLALAFFFASLDRDPALASKLVVIDDPISSLDEHRSLATVQQVRRLGERTAQVIVLSHTKVFLCHVWADADRTERASVQVMREGDGSTLSAWDVSADAITENDKRHALIRAYLLNPGGSELREVARSIRPIIEAFLRVAYPERFPPETQLGSFRNICEQRVGGPDEVLSRADTDELRDIVEYANRFHHDTNPAWETESVNDGELQGFVSRALAFTRRT